jgi:hypothetical protein
MAPPDCIIGQTTLVPQHCIAASCRARENLCCCAPRKAVVSKALGCSEQGGVDDGGALKLAIDGLKTWKGSQSYRLTTSDIMAIDYVLKCYS